MDYIWFIYIVYILNKGFYAKARCGQSRLSEKRSGY